MGRKRSPTQLSLDFLNKCGYACAIVEKWNAHAKIRQDLFGFADIIAYHPLHGIVLVQTTTAHNMKAREAKILASPHSAGWKRAGGKIILHGWGEEGLISNYV